AAVFGRTAHVGREEKSLLLRPRRIAELPVRTGQLDVVDVLEQTGGGSRRPRLRLSARGGRVLVDVPAGAKLSEPRHEAEVGVVSRPRVQHGEIPDGRLCPSWWSRWRRLRERGPDGRR